MRLAYPFLVLSLLLFSPGLLVSAPTISKQKRSAVASGSANQWAAAIASDGFGGTICTWTDNGPWTLHAQLVKPNGAKAWGRKGISLFPNHSYSAGTCMADGLGGAFFTIASGGLRLQHVTSKGETVWGEDGLLIYNSSINGHHADRDTSGVLLAWRNQLTNGQNIFIQRVNLQGVPQWGDSGLPIESDSIRQQIEGMHSDGLGGAVVTYTRATSIFSWDSSSHLRRIGPAGETLWEIPVATAKEFRIRTVSDGSGGAILLWSDGPTIFAQRYSRDAISIWGPEPTLIANYPERTEIAQAEPDGKGGVVAILARRVDSRWEYTGQAITPSGIAVFTSAPVELARDNSAYPFVVGDGSFGFSYRPTGFDSNLQFSLYSAQGQYLLTKKLRTGKSPEEWYLLGASDLAGNLSLLTSVHSEKPRGNVYLNTWEVKE